MRCARWLGWMLLATSLAAHGGDRATRDLSFAVVDAERVAEQVGDGKVSYRIVSVRPLRAGSELAAAPILTVQCPTDDLRFATTRVSAGDTLSLDWVVTVSPNRRIYGSRDGAAELRTPADGWMRRGSDGSHTVRAQMFAVFLDDEAASQPSVHGKTRRVGFFRKILPFRRGQSPQPPERIRLRLSWARPDGDARS